MSLSSQKYGFGIRDLEKTYSGSRIQGLKINRIPNPGSKSATLVGRIEIPDITAATGREMLFYCYTGHVQPTTNVQVKFQQGWGSLFITVRYIPEAGLGSTFPKRFGFKSQISILRKPSFLRKQSEIVCDACIISKNLVLKNAFVLLRRKKVKKM